MGTSPRNPSEGGKPETPYSTTALLYNFFEVFVVDLLQSFSWCADPSAVGTVGEAVSPLILANFNEYIKSSEHVIIAEWFSILCFYACRRLR